MNNTGRVEKLLEFLRDNPGDSFVKHALALEYMKTGDDSKARGLLEDVLTADPAYVGSYYQLAGLLERTGETELAIRWYEQGMAAAKAAGENRAYNELRAAYEELTG